MQRISSPAIVLSASALLFVAHGMAQQAPPASSKSSTTTTSSSSTTGTKPRSTARTAAPLTLKTDQDRISYAIGMNIANTLHRQSIEVDPKVLARAISDVLSGGKLLLTDPEAQAVLMKLQQQVQAAQMQKMQALAASNKTEGAAFLTANKNKAGVVSLPDGLQYKVLQQGTGPKPTANDVVVCNYRGSLLNGTEFDSSYKRGQPVTIPVARVIKGWTEALELMPVGSKWQLYIPSDLAYGERGAGADIGPNATIIFDVELLSIKKPEPPPATPPAGIQGRGFPGTTQPQSGGTQTNPQGANPATTKPGP